MHVLTNRAPRLILALVLLVSAVFVLTPLPSAHAAAPIFVRPDGDDTLCNGEFDASVAATPNCAVLTIQKGIDLVDPGGTVFVRTGTYVLSTVVNVNKTGITLDGDGAGATVVQVSGTGYRFDISVDGVTLQDFELEKTDTAGGQDIIWIHANSVTVKNNTIHGQFVIGDGDVSRAMVISGGLSGLNIEGNTMYALRQPAYVTGTTTGTVQNNYTYGTKGWVLEGGDLTFTGNTWGTGANANVYDIVIIPAMPGIYYTDIVAMSNANNGAVIEDQRVSPAVLSVVYVDAATAYVTDLGGRYHPYSSIAPAIVRVVAGGTINVADGTYAESPVVNKSLTLQSQNGRDVTTINLQTGPTYLGAMDISGATVTVDGFTINGLDAANPVLASSNVYVRYPADTVTLSNNRFGVGQIDGGSNGDDGFGIVTEYNLLNSISSLTVTDNIIQPLNAEGQRAFYINPGVDQFTFTGNAITGKFAGSAGIQANNSLIENNTITGVGAAGSRSAGMFTWGEPDSSLYGKATFRANSFTGVASAIRILSANDALVENNTFDQVGTGVYVSDEYGPTFDPTTADIHNNAFLSFDNYAVDNQEAALVDASGNWFGSNVPATVAASVSTTVDYTPWLNVGTDTSAAPGFQGDFSNLWVDDDSPQTGAVNRIQEGVDMVTASTVNVVAGSYPGDVLLNKSVELKGAQYGVAVSGRTAGDASESTVTGLITVDFSDVEIDGFTLTNPGQTNAVYIKADSPSHSDITINHNIVDTVGGPAQTPNVHAILVYQGPDSVTIAHNRFNNIKSGAYSLSAIGVLDTASTDPSTDVVIDDNTFSDIASTTKGAYGVLINNAAGVSSAQITNNTFSGLNGGWTHAIGLEGPTLNAVVTGNIFSGLTAAGADKSAIFFEKNLNGGTVTVECNQFNGTAFYGVAIHPDDLPGGSNGYNYVVNADNNWWNAASGPYHPISNPAGTGALVGNNVDFDPWLTIPGNCVANTGSWQNQQTMAYNDLQGSLNAATPGQEIKFVGAGPLPGGATANNPGVTINLNGGTFGPGSPFLTVNSDNITVVGPGTLDGGGSAFPAILVQSGAGNFTLRGVEIKGWADGIQVAGPVISLKITNNWIHDNTDAGLQVDATPTGVITINGNLFKANGGPGVVYSGAGALNATYNSWGDLGGPTVGAGDGVGAGVTYIPWTFSEIYMDVDPPANALTRSVPETTNFNVALKVDAAKLYGLTFQVAYDPAMLTLNTTTFAVPWSGGPCVALSAPLGVIKYRCNLTFPAAQYDATGGVIATFNFTANTMPPGNGPWPTYFDISADPANTSTGALGGIKVFVNNAGYGAPSVPSRDITDADDGEIIIVGLANFNGFVDLQGNDNDSGAVLLVKNQQAKLGAVDLASGTSVPSGAYATAHLPTKMVLVGSTYWLQFDAPLHLPTTTILGSVSFPFVPTDWTNSALATTRPLTPLAFAFLLGGDATNNDVVDVNDASCIGTFYQIAFTDCGGAPGSSPDVKVNGAVDIFDLVLMGSNYELTYSPWTQP